MLSTIYNSRVSKCFFVVVCFRYYLAKFRNPIFCQCNPGTVAFDNAAPGIHDTDLQWPGFPFVSTPLLCQLLEYLLFISLN